MSWIIFRNILCFLGLVSLISCNHESKKPSISPAINIEMFGSWRSDNGCAATFAKINDRLVLTKFTDEKNNTLSNIILISKKISIMTTFKPENKEVDFSGSFLEGVIIINSHCTGPLHKVDN